MRYPNKDDFALRSTVGVAARLTIEEGVRRPRFALWHPYNPRKENT
jgi:hypothetical protein